MKKILRIFPLIMTLLFASTVMAESYTVKKDDTLSEIATKNGVTVKEIQAVNPKIKKIDQIQLGWKLEIPTKGADGVKKIKSSRSSKIVRGGEEWVNPGRDVYLGDRNEGLTILGYSSATRSGIANAIKNGQPKFAIINHISRGGLVVADDGTKYRMKKMLGGGGKGRPIKVLGGPNGVIPKWHNKNKVEGGKIYSFGNEYFLSALICGNPTLIEKIVDEPPVPVEVKIKPPPKEIPPDMSMIIPPMDGKRRPKILDRWDLYTGAGNYNLRHDGSDNHGKYGWMKYRNRPFWFALEKNSMGVKDIGAGFVGFLAGGNGSAARHYDYKHREVALGVTAKAYAEKSDFDFDAMLGRLWNKGSWMGNEVNEQVDDVLRLSSHGNFYSDTEYFHKFELNVDIRTPLHTDVKKGEKSSSQTFEGTYTQWITKFEVGENGTFDVAPGFNLGAGYERGAVHKESLKTGPALELSSYDNVMAGISVYNYKFQGSGQWHPVSGYVSFDGISNAWKAAHITGLSAEELQNLSGSKLLSNPADYLDAAQ